MDNDVQKPISVIHEEFIVNLAGVINNSMLPPFVIESVLKDAYMEVKGMAQKQLQYDKEQYEEALNSCKEQECEDVVIDEVSDKE